MTGYEAKSVALSAAANATAEGFVAAKGQVSAAIAFLAGKADKASFVRKCAKNPLYARLVCYASSPAEYDADAFCALHKTLFDGQRRCGEIRTEELTLVGGSCTDPKLLRGSLKNALGKMGQIQGAPEANKADFAAQLCCYLRELIILSPFSYGNGIVRRAFVESFCRHKGFSLCYAAVPKKELFGAETEAFASDNPQPLFSLLMQCLTYLQEEVPAKRKLARKSAPLRIEGKKVRDTAQKESIASKNRPLLTKAPKPSAPPPSARTAKSSPEIVRELREMQRELNVLHTRMNDLMQKLDENEENEEK